ncbi:MAG: roadblock/LC7 domain-containing protein [Gammaproteobacteria bacterium]
MVHKTFLDKAAALLAEQEKQKAERELQKLLDTCPGAHGALLATADGFVVAKVFKEDMADKTLAAISSSLMSLAESVAYEGRQGPCQNVIVEAEAGHVVSLRINHTRVLTVIAARRTRLGMLLSAAKVGAEQLAKILDSGK